MLTFVKIFRLLSKDENKNNESKQQVKNDIDLKIKF